MDLKDDTLMAIASMMLLSNELPGRMVVFDEQRHKQFGEELKPQIAALMGVLMKEGLASGNENVGATLSPYMSKMGNLTFGQSAVAPIYYTTRVEVSACSEASDDAYVAAVRTKDAVYDIMKKYGNWKDADELIDQLNRSFPDFKSLVIDNHDKCKARFEGIGRKAMAKQSSSASSSSSSGGGCYVATAVYGSYDCPEVWTLRRFRDYRLAKTALGRAFVKTYYAVSPSLVKTCGDSAVFKNMARKPLDWLVTKCKDLGYVDEPYKDREW